MWSPLPPSLQHLSICNAFILTAPLGGEGMVQPSLWRWGRDTWGNWGWNLCLFVIREEQRFFSLHRLEGPASASHWAKWDKLPTLGLSNSNLVRSRVLFKQKYALYTPSFEFPMLSLIRHVLNRVIDIFNFLQMFLMKDKPQWPLDNVHGNVHQSQNSHDNLLTMFSFPPLQSKSN